MCVASSRVFVQEGIYDEFEKKLVEKAKTWVIGDPFDPKVQQGPQVRKLASGAMIVKTYKLVTLETLFLMCKNRFKRCL